MKKKKKKKILRITGVVFLALVGILLAIPLLLEGKIGTLIKNKVNQNINATLDFNEADLSLLGSFPNAKVSLKGTTLVNKAPFEGDTLFSSEKVALTMGIGELFNSAEDPIAIKSLVIDGAKLHIKIDEQENANYDIAKEDDKATTSSQSGGNDFSFDLELYEITNSKVVYDDRSTDMRLVVSEIRHTGKGDLSLATSELQTKTDALLSLEMDSISYLDKNKVALDALIGIDLNENRYSFLKNEALVNQLPLVFDGFVKVNDDNQEIDISFKTPSSDFKNFLAVIPTAYSKSIGNVETSGNFEVNGRFEGILDEEHIPRFNIKVNSENASFKYPNLPKSVRNVNIDAEVVNASGLADDTFVRVKKLTFQIDDDRFAAQADITDLLGNTKVKAALDGKINLANISKAYPVPAGYDLSGLLTADVSTAFDMASIENQRYENTKTTGTLNLQGFQYNSPELKNPVVIDEAALKFNPTTVTLNNFSGKTGQTDFRANGTITNLLGYLFNKEDIQGNFQLRSNTFAVNDFMVEQTTEEGKENAGSTSTEMVKIPSFLNCTIDATANNVIYDNLNLTSVSGRLLVKEETATIQGLTSSLFGGKLNLNGKVSTKPEVPVFDMALGVDGFQISESFAAMDMLKVLAPIAKVLEGKLNSTINLSGNLKNDMTPDLATLSGNLLAELLSTEFTAERTPLLSTLDSKLDFLNLQELDLNGLKTALSFENGTVAVKPFDIKYKDFVINVAGGHTFDQKLQYNVTIDVPAKYLGSEVNKLLAQIDDTSLENLTIPVIANIGGSYTNPNVTTDLTTGVRKLTSQLVEIQKEKLKNQGKDAAKDLIGGLFKKDSTAGDSSAAEKSDVKAVLGGLLGNKKKDTTTNDSTGVVKDTVTTGDVAKKAAKNILGGLLGGKKKKDSVN
ncbi:MAG: AsmA family protein [Muricauda sp.]|nr:AsmA-like C-terminal region-containing protein [Allomuricauda sp.]MBC31981.1 AsmA family protein [Allomuricauda sp.]|tara:strand:- start:57583 stop:60306 length:2724 start_codon:yes stop_codon:yes gene_type:complete